MFLHLTFLRDLMSWTIDFDSSKTSKKLESTLNTSSLCRHFQRCFLGYNGHHSNYFQHLVQTILIEEWRLLMTYIAEIKVRKVYVMLVVKTWYIEMVLDMFQNIYPLICPIFVYKEKNPTRSSRRWILSRGILESSVL